MMVNNVKEHPSSIGAGAEASAVAENVGAVATRDRLLGSDGCGLYLFDLEGGGVGAVGRAEAPRMGKAGFGRKVLAILNNVSQKMADYRAEHPTSRWA